MKPPITTFWAKLGPLAADGSPTAWHPLIDHCADVAAVLRALLDRPIIRHWLGAMAGLSDLDEVQRDRLSFLGALHDVGKVNIGFQNKRLARAPFTAGHVAPVLDLFGGPGPEGARLADALGIEMLLPWAADEDDFSLLLTAVFAHHGRPVRPQAYYQPRLWQPNGDLDPFAGAAQLRHAAERWFPGAFAQIASPLRMPPAFQHGFNGLLTLADWIGSHPDFFPFSTESDGDRFPWAQAQAEIVLQRLGLVPEASRRSLGVDAPGFSAISKNPPRELQTQLLELPVPSGGSIAVLEAETGAGKTEAALARFLRLFHAGVVDGLYFALPTRTAATQIHRRVYDAVQRAFSEEERRPQVVLAVPGYLSVDDREGVRLPGFEVRWPDDDRERWRYRGWAAENSKRYLAGTVVVGTVDQVLMSALAVSHSHMRAAALSRHLLVVDEVHASDAYMTHVLEAVLARHLGAGGHALLMSATLGAVSRARLIHAGRTSATPSLAQALIEPYPLVTHAAAPAWAPVTVPLPPSGRKRVHVERAPVAEEPAAIATLGLAAACAGARVLVVRNTVAECIAVQEALEAAAAEDAHAQGAAERSLLFRCAGVAAPHHARFAREDRRALDEAIETRFGRGSSGGSGCIAVATQTVQQSLDLDADLLLTDLCPMDVLLQRLGRLHRHIRDRPRGFEQPRAIVLVTADRNLARLIRLDGKATGPHGLGTVYPDLRVLEATWRELERHDVLGTPEMNRALVEATTHPEALDAIVRELGEPWIAHGHWITGTLLAHVRIAGSHLARWDVAFPEAQFPDDGVRVGTRLGAEDRLAEFDAPLPGPFGEPVHRLTLPHRLVRGADVEARPEEVSAASGTISFRFGTRRYRYDRLGLRTVDAPTPDDEEDDA